MYRFLIAVWLLAFTAPGIAAATSYYISPSGKDANAGTSPSTAWASIAKVNRTTFKAGDVILFEGGKTFSGGISFGSTAGTLAKVRGTSTSPITLTSYGTGRAIISSGSATGLKGYNTAGFSVKNLIFKGPGSTSTGQNGIAFYTDVPNTTLTYIYIYNVEVYGYQHAGISISSWDDLTTGFGSVTISNSKIHDNGEVGLTVYAQGRLLHKNFVIRNNKVYNNSGLTNKTESHSGSGIELGDVDGATVELNEAYNNGWLNASTTNGPIGIWGYRCNNLVIQRNEAHHNKTGTTKDGGGFDLDGGCTNSTMQYNYSHNNDGAGFLLGQYSGAPLMKGITVRYNISENDGRKNDYGGIHLWSSGSNGGIQDVNIYNNTVYITPSTNATPIAFMVRSGGFKNVRIRNNILQSTGGVTLVRVNYSTDVLFQGNDYWSTGSSFKILWAGKTYTSLSAWRTATGQEKRSGIATGYSYAPDLADPGKGVTISNTSLLYTLTGYKLKSTSALIGKGLNLKSLFATSIGTQDYFGDNLSQLASFAIGAHEPGATVAAATAPLAAQIEPVNLRQEPLAEVYPNPMQQEARLRFSVPHDGPVWVAVYDLRGAEIAHIAAPDAVAGQVYDYQLDGSRLADGVYLVRVRTAEEVQTVKVVVRQ